MNPFGIGIALSSRFGATKWVLIKKLFRLCLLLPGAAPLDPENCFLLFIPSTQDAGAMVLGIDTSRVLLGKSLDPS